MRRNKMKKVLSIILATMMTLGVFTGCSGNTSSTSSPGGNDKPEKVETSSKEEAPAGEVLYSNGGPIEFFEHPWLNPGTFNYMKTLFDHLLVADETLAPVGNQLAESHEISADGMNLSFVLRDDILWHDGEKITAEDVKWSIEYALKITGINAVFATTFNAIKGAEEFVEGKADEIAGITIDGQNIAIEFVSIAPDALLTFTQFAPLPKAHFEGQDPLNFQQSPYWQSPVGSGPFMVDEVRLNEYTTLKPFQDYYNGVPEFSIYLTPSPGDSDSNLVTNAQAGMVDYAYTKSVDDAAALEAVPGLTVTQVDIRYTRLFYMNKFPKADGRPSPVGDPRVRQAIAYAVDMEAIAQNLFKGAAIPANSLTPNEPIKADGLNDYAYNPEKAKELLTEANWDESYELDVVYYYTDQQTVDFMAAIQSYLKDVGIKMNFRLIEGDIGTLLWTPPADPVNGPSAVEWDLAYGANGALSLHEYYDRYQTGSPANSHTPGDPKLDALIAATNATFDNDEITAAFRELQKYENETLFSYALYYQPVFIIESDKIKKGAPAYGNPQFNYNWEIQNWSLSSK